MDPKDHFEMRRKKAEIRRIHFATSLHTGVEAWSIMGTPPAHIFADWALKLAHSAPSSFHLVVRNHFIL